MQIRQRMGAIATIQKITHSMRLISMSAHTRLKSREKSLAFYTSTLKNLFEEAKAQLPDWHNPILQPKYDEYGKQMVILIGSDKGLCGNFNVNMFYFFEEYSAHYNPETTTYVAIGKKAIEYLEQKKKVVPHLVYKQFIPKTAPAIARTLLEQILSPSIHYQSVTVFSNVLATFFTQRPEKSILIPFQTESTTTAQGSSNNDFYWEQEPTEVVDFLAKQTLNDSLEHLLFQSLIAEQSARFISMDSATRNADRLLEQTKLRYNKLRQAIITKELTELSSSIGT